ncbi:hypothetical protein OG729_15150 [Streptomyces sp. NBC_00210]|uniref:hypothetical protein n=1 Tax=unclassified Streptomyces TaxID=2593676 RepID=UPI0032537A1D
MARHKAPQPPRLALLRAGLTVATVAAALGAGGAAHAAPASAPVGLDTLEGQAQRATGVVTNSLAGAGQLKNLQLNPLANTGVDPLDNSVGTQVADFKPVSTEAVTGPLAAGAAAKDLPVVGGATRLLPF